MENSYSPRSKIGNPTWAPNLGNRSPNGGRSSRTRDRIQTMAMIFAQPIAGTNMGLGQSWTIADVGMAASVKGIGWDKYRNRCWDMGAPFRAFYDTTSEGQPGFAIGSTSGYGDTVAMFAGLNFDYIAWGYAPPQNWLQRVDYWAARAGRPAPKQGFYFLNILNVNQAIPQDAFSAALRTIQLDTGEVFTSASASVPDGCTTVDIYEGSSGVHDCGISFPAGTSTVHTWEIDYLNSTTFNNMCLQMASEVASMLATHWPVRKPDFMITDNALADPSAVFGGSVTNGAELSGISPATFRATWAQWPTAFKAANPTVEFWGNHGLPDATYYTASQLPARYGEFGFSTTTAPSSTSASLSTLQSRILTAKTLGTKWAPDHSYRGSGNMDLWRSSVGPGGGNTWEALKNYSTSIDAFENFIAVACRTSSGFYTHYHPEFDLN